MDYSLTVITNDNAEGHTDQTTVEDINSRGMFFFLPRALTRDKTVRLNVAVSPGGGWMQRIIEVKAEGRVLRSVPESGAPQRFGTAVEFVRPLTLRFEGSYAT